MSKDGLSARRGMRLLAATILWLSMGGLALAASDPVTVYYFYATTRCDGCLEIERLADEILRQEFSRELADGRLRWQPVNVDLPENSHFIFDFDLAANELVVSHGDGAQERAWEKLPDVWKLADDPEQLQTRLVRMVANLLGEATDDSAQGRTR